MAFWQWHVDNDMLTMTCWQWHFDNDILTMSFLQWHFDNDILTMTFWQWHFDNGILTMTFWQWQLDNDNLTMTFWHWFAELNCSHWRENLRRLSCAQAKSSRFQVRFQSSWSLLFLAANTIVKRELFKNEYDRQAMPNLITGSIFVPLNAFSNARQIFFYEKLVEKNYALIIFRKCSCPPLS
jgi:hypothetical protein